MREWNPPFQLEKPVTVPIVERAMLWPRRRGNGQMGCEGIEPLVDHLTFFSTTALQAAVRNTTLRWHRRESNPQSPRFELGRFADLRTVPLVRAPGRDLNP